MSPRSCSTMRSGQAPPAAAGSSSRRHVRNGVPSDCQPIETSQSSSSIHRSAAAVPRARSGNARSSCSRLCRMTPSSRVHAGMSSSIHCCATAPAAQAAACSGDCSFQPSVPAFHFAKSGMKRPCVSASLTCGASAINSFSSRLNSSRWCCTAAGCAK
ncbi:hypothetical protein LJK88_49350 [Paenibacillus sp. P26]|nr:hypothetical protein LJK88_49350 [Paenibacillus sp. P26]